MKRRNYIIIIKCLLSIFIILFSSCNFFTINNENEEIKLPEINVKYEGEDLLSSITVFNLGSILENTNSDVFIFTIENTGNVYLNLTGLPYIEISGDNADDFTITQPNLSRIPVGGSITFTIMFTPLSNGVKTAIISIPNDDPDENPFTFNLIGTATATPEPEINVTQGTINLQDDDTIYDFGIMIADGNEGVTSSFITFIIENIGSLDLIITDLYISGTNMDDFDIIDNTTSPITPQESTSFTIRFDSLTIGRKFATVTINNNDADEGVFTFTVCGTGGLPDINVKQGATDLINGSSIYDFSTIQVDGDNSIASSYKTFFIENIGTANLIITDLYISGINMDDFDIIDNTTSPITPQESTSFTIRFDPLTIGNKSAIVTINNNDTNEGVFTFTVSGTGKWQQQAKLLASDGEPDDGFGSSVSISGNYAIVGSPHNNNSIGIAYIYYWDGLNWIEQTKLSDINGESIDQFGGSVDIFGNYAIVGVPMDISFSGSAYIYNWNGLNWVEQAKLTARFDNYDVMEFGCSVSISGNYIIVGAAGDDIYTGSAYIYYWDGLDWIEQAKLTASDRDDSDCFGTVDISGDYAIVGAFNAYNGGSAYIFYRNGSIWEEQAKLKASDGEPGDHFGRSVSISGDYAIVGARHDDDNGNNSGSAYIFYSNGLNWVEQAKLLASDGGPDDYFGTSVNISGDYAIIGAEGNGYYNSGNAYIFHNNEITWEEELKIIANDGIASDYFGCSVSISENYAIVGARYDDDNGMDSGSAYIFINQ